MLYKFQDKKREKSASLVLVEVNQFLKPYYKYLSTLNRVSYVNSYKAIRIC